MSWNKERNLLKQLTRRRSRAEGELLEIFNVSLVHFWCWYSMKVVCSKISFYGNFYEKWQDANYLI